MRTPEEIALNFNVPILQYCKFVREAWEITEKEELQNKINHRLALVNEYIGKLGNEASELINYCSVLIESNKDMTLEDFYKEMHNPKSNDGPCGNTNGPWMTCFNLFLWHYDKMLFYEENERKELCKYTLSGSTVYRETTINGKLISYVEADPIMPHYPAYAYCQYRKTYEYKLCHQLCDFISTKCRMGQWAQSLLAKLLLTVCLYIALQNENDKLLGFIRIFRERSAPAPQTATPEPQTNEATSATEESKPVTIPHELDTERARKSFRNAIAAGFMEQTENGYHWTFGGNQGKVRLGYFLVKVYCPTNTEQLPLKAVEKLFNVDRLDSAINRFNGTSKDQKWILQIDELFED